jgi:Glycine zipper
MMTRLKRLAMLVCGAIFFSSLTLTTAQPYIYPNQGQSPQQEQLDKGQCYSWAVQQTGFDPANPQVGVAPPPGMQAPQGGMFRGAAGGAAMGAIGGAIGGDAGEGAAIGAGVGALFGGLRRARERREQEQMQQAYAAQQQGAMSQGRSNYERAFGACMAGRGYTVR